MTSPLGPLGPIPQIASTPQLLERLISTAVAMGHARGSPKGPKGGGPQGLFWKLKREVELLRAQILERLGAEALSPEVTNRDAFLYITIERRQSSCAQCGQRPYRAAGLHFWAPGTGNKWEPTLLLMAHLGMNRQGLRDLRDGVVALCRVCAKQRGGRLLANGNPDLSFYQID